MPPLHARCPRKRAAALPISPHRKILAMFDLATVKLGKLPPKHDMRIPMLAHYTAALPPAPAAIDWSDGHTDDWGDMGNDVLGDCTCAGVGHAIQVFTLNAMHQRKTIPDPTVIGLYEQFGYNPSDPSTDQGAVETDVLNYWLKNPVAGHAIEGYVSLQPKDIRDVRDAIWLFGGSYIGLALPKSIQGQGTWMVPASGLEGDGAPGSLGGHCTYVVGYDARGLTCITWGKLQRMSWNFWWAYCDESYGLLSKDWLAMGKAPSGFDATALIADMAALRAA
jgi:hypothetical protein